jgi:hypothetical protein
MLVPEFFLNANRPIFDGLEESSANQIERISNQTLRTFDLEYIKIPYSRFSVYEGSVMGVGDGLFYLST